MLAARAAVALRLLASWYDDSRKHFANQPKGGTSMNHKVGIALCAAAAVGILGGCAGSEVQTTTAPPPRPAVVVAQPAPTAPVVVAPPAPSAPVVVTQPAPVSSRAVLVSPGAGGHWEMRGAGTPSSPYFWVWVPMGTTIMTMAPPPVPQVVVASEPTIVSATEGRWQLYGDGSRDRPYMWYWVPRGVNAPPPPAIYRPES
jgi:hypothetical protein